MVRMWADDEFVGGLEPDRRREVAEGERDGPAEVDVAGVPEEPHARVRPVLYERRLVGTHRHRRRLLLLLLLPREVWSPPSASADG